MISKDEIAALLHSAVERAGLTLGDRALAEVTYRVELMLITERGEAYAQGVADMADRACRVAAVRGPAPDTKVAGQGI